MKTMGVHCAGIRYTTRGIYAIAVAVLLIAPAAGAQDLSSTVSLSSVSAQEVGDESSRAVQGQADSGADGERNAKAKSKETGKKKKRSSKKANNDDAPGEDETVKPSKHPTWTPVPGITLDFKARIESELRTDPPALGFEHSEIDWQDRRLGVEGAAFKRVTFEISRELRQDFEASHDLSDKTAWKDVYVNARVSRALNLEAGRFKLPFGREELTNEPSLDFVNRSLAARVLSPGRDVGIMAHGRLFNRRMSYQGGYFTRDGDNGRTSETIGGHDAFAGRVVVMPWATHAGSALASIEVGVAAAASQVDNLLGLRGRTVFGDGIFFDRVYVNGQRRRVGLDAAWHRGSRSVSAEYILVSDERRAMGFSGDDLPNVVARAWYVAGTWALTGEHKDGRLEPRHDLLRGGIGAVELTARAEELRFESTDYPGADFGFPAARKLSTNADYAVTVGINWYVNHYVKLQGNLVVEAIQDAERSPAPGTDGRFVSPALLLQFRF